MHYITPYPATAAERDRFVIDLRGPRLSHDPRRFQGLTVDDEMTESGTVARVGTVFLTGRECPWRCVMCDLWQHTTREDTPAGAIPKQIEMALAFWRGRGETISRIKLYNASNFFDPRAVPESDYAAIGALVSGLEQVIVESHPSLVGDRVAGFRDALGGAALEVAMGLETAHPEALDALNKRMTLDDFSRASAELARLGVSLRVFLLVGPPFIADEEQDRWLLRSVEFAEQCGAAVISLIPARGGNGTMEALTAQKLFRRPTADDVLRSFEFVVARPKPELRASSPVILLDPWSGANAG